MKANLRLDTSPAAQSAAVAQRKPTNPCLRLQVRMERLLQTKIEHKEKGNTNKQIIHQTYHLHIHAKV